MILAKKGEVEDRQKNKKNSYGNQQELLDGLTIGC